MRHLFLVVLLFSTMAQTLSGETKVKSGLQPGQTAGAFYVEDITGPKKGTRLCYACAFAKKHVVNIQTHRVSDELIKLLKKLDTMVDPATKRDSKARHAFLVLLTDDPDGAAKQLRAVAKKHGIKNIPLTVYDDPDGPRGYQLHRQAETTVMMWVNTKVAVNRAFAKGKLDAKRVSEVLALAKKHLR